MRHFYAQILPSHTRGSQVQSPDLPITQWGDRLLVDARLLHQRLRSGYHFAHWIRARIQDYGFQENEDFFASKSFEAKRGKGGHNRVDYLLTLDTAKEMAMLERNEIGRMIRRYFIQKEKEARGEVLALPREDLKQIFAGLTPLRLNRRTLYPFRKTMIAIGSNHPSGPEYHYRKRYPNRFVSYDDVHYISEELALQIYYNRLVTATRKANKKMQPVLPPDFSDKKEIQGGSHV
ncbi:MAG: antA/AntB antirepressor family protein [Bacteroidetes bacterium]|nr:antA/AntB antirepressor family protein [Bacteroidota bacterium]